MEFNLDQEQTLLKNEARRFLQNECPIDFVKEMEEHEEGYSPVLWRKMAELGWMGLFFDEKYGGTSGTFFDLALLIEEMGRVLLPGPFFSTVILGGATIIQSEDEGLKKRFLPGIANGNVMMTLALVEKEGSYAMERIESKGELKADGYLLEGRKMFVPNAHVADHIIFPAKTSGKGHPNGTSLFIVDMKSEGVGIIPLLALDLEKQFEVNFNRVHVPENNLLGKEGEGEVFIHDLWPVAVTVTCCRMLGAMQKVFEITVDYSQKRRQFDRPLSAFQVIQHYCADMAIELECSRLIAYQAAWRVSNGLPSKMEVAMAKAWVSEALKEIVAIAHQIHGGIGFTKEQNIYLYFRYAKACEVTFGDANFHKGIVAGEMD